MAGAAKVDGTLPKGTPLAGYNHGARRVPYWPAPEVKEYTTFMTGSTGAINPTWVKALVIDNGNTKFAWATLDGIGSDGGLMRLGFELAGDMGFTIPRENVIFSASHTHSGPGAVSAEMLWALAPATDLLVPELQQKLAASIAEALVTAEKTMKPAKIAFGMGNLVNVTRNRRAKISPYVNTDTIDPHLGVIRVDDDSGKAIATLWNFATHGTCYGPDNMQFSSDIMGYACELVEEQVGGVALFVNGDAGDIDPTSEACENKPQFAGSPKIAAAILETRAKLNTSKDVGITAYSRVFDFGPTNLNLTLERMSNCTHGGPLDICTFCEFFKCDLNAHLPDNYVENQPWFTAVRFDFQGQHWVMVTMPGEPLIELGWQVRNDTKALGFDQTFLAGYSQSHMGYFATPNEYDIGGYEGLLSFWGRQTAEIVREAVKTVATAVKP
eukprot:TRINITY_DN513_c0_g1_i15.p3 TRINITY_DN513_c0_g1~~TRINITY_DN513_c0_g1_i15.p3  ORF type:complete len:441 (-),score=141.77 TRINITY_DN513_c0_g1_i15:4571-5893(-)